MVALSTGGRVAGFQKRRRLVAKDSPRILTVARGAAYIPCPLPLISSRPFNSPDAASTLELVHVRRQRSGSPAVELCRRYRDRGAKRYGRHKPGRAFNAGPHWPGGLVWESGLQRFGWRTLLDMPYHAA
jgi:hypothetical protein